MSANTDSRKNTRYDLELNRAKQNALGGLAAVLFIFCSVGSDARGTQISPFSNSGLTRNSKLSGDVFDKAQKNLRPQLAQQAQQSSQAQQASGTVSSYDDTKGYGFIAPDDGSAAVFVHISALERAGLRTLRAGQKITYTVVLDRRSGKFSADELHLVSAR
jgi:CspA family cold shock protein